MQDVKHNSDEVFPALAMYFERRFTEDLLMTKDPPGHF